MHRMAGGEEADVRRTRAALALMAAAALLGACGSSDDAGSARSPGAPGSSGPSPARPGTSVPFSEVAGSGAPAPGPQPSLSSIGFGDSGGVASRVGQPLVLQLVFGGCDASATVRDVRAIAADRYLIVASGVNVARGSEVACPAIARIASLSITGVITPATAITLTLVPA
jgi:hypothetical protein